MDAITRAGRTAHASLRVAAALGFLGVGLGAFGAHGLEGRFDGSGLDPAEVAERLDWWKTAASYHLAHAVALAAAASYALAAGVSARAATILFGGGVVLFSGTLYAMALGAPRWFGAITPLGGLLLMGGWLALFLFRPSQT